jgi:hypothetical protein
MNNLGLVTVIDATASAETDAVLLETKVVRPERGHMAIIIRNIAGPAKSRTAYVYAENTWQAI